MRCLLDTHVLIWAIESPEKLTADARSVIEDSGNQLLISIVSFWEISIKVGQQKLKLSTEYYPWARLALEILPASILPVTLEATEKQRQLPSYHRDPFDRMMIAQAIVNDHPIISADEKFDLYGDVRLW